MMSGLVGSVDCGLKPRSGAIEGCVGSAPDMRATASSPLNNGARILGLPKIELIGTQRTPIAIWVAQQSVPNCQQAMRGARGHGPFGRSGVHSELSGRDLRSGIGGGSSLTCELSIDQATTNEGG